MSIVSGIFQANATEDAASTQAEAATTASDATLQATRETNEMMMDMYQQGRKDTAPWRTAGANALTTLQKKIAEGPGKFKTSANYVFTKSEGEKAVQRSAAAKGSVLGGATLKALSRYNQNLASSEYQNFLNNYYQSLTPYQSLAQIGQTTATQGATQGNQVAGNIATNTQSGTQTSNNALMTAANANAQGIINRANAISNASSNAVNTTMAGLSLMNYLGWL